MNEDEPLYQLSVVSKSGSKTTVYTPLGDAQEQMRALDDPSMGDSVFMLFEGMCEHPDRAPVVLRILREQVESVCLVRV